MPEPREASVRWSVLLPTHDRPDTLQHSMRSVLAQTDGDLELIVVGDGCNDATRAVVASFDDPRIQFLDLPKAEGYGYASRADALRHARGRYLAFAADDDLWAPLHLECLGQVLDSGHALAYSLPLWVVPTGEVVPTPIDLGVAPERATFMAGNYLPATSVVARRDAVERVGGWPADVPSAADWELWKRIIELPGVSIGVLPFGTALHFRALWRSGEHFAAEFVLSDGDPESWWPDAARVPAGGGDQQARTAPAVAEAAWWRALAAATDLIERHLAFEWVYARRQIEQLEHELDEASRALDNVDRGYRDSTSWRITAPLRQIAGWFAKRG